MATTANINLPLETHGHVAIAKTVEAGFKKIDEAIGGLSGGSGGPVTVTVANISDASTVGRNVLKATDAAAARTAIGAGTSSLVIGTTASTAMAGNTTIPAAAAAGTAAQLTTGTDSTQRTWTAADLNAFVNAKIAAAITP